MNEQIIKMLKDNIRKLTADLAHWHTELHKRDEAFREAMTMCQMLQAQLSLCEGQLESLNERA